MKWFDAGTQKMSVPSFSIFIKLIKVQCTGPWVSQQDRSIGAVIAVTGAVTVVIGVVSSVIGDVIRRVPRPAEVPYSR